MSATTDSPTTPTVVADTPPPHRQSRLTQAALWVGIVAGVVFIVAVVFFSGFTLGRHSGGHGFRGDDRGSGMFHHGGPPPMMPMGPRQFPGGPGGEPAQPGEPPTPTAPRP